MSSQNAVMANNLSVLAHAVELSTKVVLKLAQASGDDTVSEAAVADACAARLQASLAPHIGA